MRLDSVVAPITNSSSEAFMLPQKEGGFSSGELEDMLADTVADAVAAGSRNDWQSLVGYLDEATRESTSRATRDELVALVAEGLDKEAQGYKSTDRKRAITALGLVDARPSEIAETVADRILELHAQGLGRAASELASELSVGWRAGTATATEDEQLRRLVALGRGPIDEAAERWVGSELVVSVTDFAVHVSSSESRMPPAARELVVSLGGVSVES